MSTVKRNPRRKTAQSAGVASPKAARDSAATRAALVAAACDIFKSSGYFATDTNAIARAAGYAPGTFYNHFADKTAIMLAVLERYSEIEWAAISKAAAHGDTRARLRAVLGAVNTLHAEWDMFRADLRALEGREPSIAAALRERVKPQIQAIAAMTGLDPERDAATAILIRMVVQRLSEAMGDCRLLGVDHGALLHSAEVAIMALLESAAPSDSPVAPPIRRPKQSRRSLKLKA